MSRHIIPNAPGSPARRVTTVGWDAPLTTFFAMAFDVAANECDDDIEVFWVGCMPNEIRTLGAITDALAGHGVAVPDDVLTLLVADKYSEGDRSDNVGRRLVDAMLAERERAR